MARIVSTPDYATPWLDETDIDTSPTASTELPPSVSAGAPMQIVHVVPPSSKPPPNGFQGTSVDSGPDNDLTAAVTSAQISQVSGRYIVWRGKGGGTGCILNLDGKVKGAAGNFRATLLPACRDQGLAGLDPSGWTIEHGRLVISTRNGVSSFERRADGTWAKEGDAQGLVLTKD